MSEVSKEACLVSMKFRSQLWEIISKYPPRLLNRSSRTAVSKDQRACWPNKNWFARKASFARSRVCRRCRRSMLHAAWYPARLYKYYVEGVKRNKIIINEYLRLHLRLLFVMSEVSKALYTQMNRMKPQILQWLSHYLIQSRSHCNSNFKSKRVLIQRNNPK